ncbi:hypothetical protein CU254_41905 (plasmid) [Amycolatopsis sp. AA4]|uniref:hypothetical protein n=1 Tax=Actinomycetes TaxID=1760 RepID=UPI0001B56C2A|nr:MULTISPECIES: hypothetical protein [Actinomycetes]ATY17134.1 hypothetical protein CU254_41905 [Amycolatopsis sp. AA4]EFL12635.1 predicted protein [Streptomyces sp. AA4]
MNSPDIVACRPLESVAVLGERALLAHGAVRRAVEEYVHWTLQHAYALLRAEFPAATSLLVEAIDGSDGACRVLRVRAGEADLWRSEDRTGRDDADNMVLDLGVLFEDAVRHQLPHRLPGWSTQDRKAGFYVADLTALPPALNTSCDHGPASEVAPGIRGLLAETSEGWSQETRRAVQEYSRGLVEGRYRPLDSIAKWATVPEQLGHPVPQEGFLGYGDGGELGVEDWRSGITVVHSLAAGVVKCWGTPESYGTPDDLRARVRFGQASLRAHGVSLREVSLAFDGDVRLAAAVLHPFAAR